MAVAGRSTCDASADVAVGDNVRVSDQPPAPLEPPPPAPAHPPAMEYLDAGPPESGGAGTVRRRRSWVPVVAGVVAFFLVLGTLGLVVGDWALRNAEARQLVTAIEGSERAMTDLQRSVEEAFGPYQGQDRLTDEDQAQLDVELQKVAAAGKAGVATRGSAVEAVAIVSWHPDLRAAREAYLAHNRAWQDYLGKAAEDPSEFARRQEAVNDTFAAAEDPVRMSIPSPDLFGLRARVDAIFAPPPAEGGPTQSA